MQNSYSTRRFWWPRLLGFAFFVAVLIGGWLIAWNWGSQRLELETERTLSRFAENGLFLDCQGKQITGFPFRLGLRCNSVYAKQTTDGSALTAGEFRSAAQFYAPGKIVAELDSPAKYEPAGSLPYIIDWSLLRASANASLEGLKELAVDADDIRLLDGWAPEAPPVASANDIKVFMRLSPQDRQDLDLAFTSDGVRIAGDYLPEIKVNGDFLLKGLATDIGPGFDLNGHLREHGLEGTVRSISLEPASGGRIELSGPFRIHRDGSFSGDVRVGAAQFNQLSTFLAQILPGQTEAIDIAGDLLNGLGNEDGDLRTLTMTVERGELSIGIVVLGTIPPIF